MRGHLPSCNHFYLHHWCPKVPQHGKYHCSAFDVPTHTAKPIRGLVKFSNCPCVERDLTFGAYDMYVEVRDANEWRPMYAESAKEEGVIIVVMVKCSYLQ